MSSNEPPGNYCGVLKEHLKTCAKGTKWRVYNQHPPLQVTSSSYLPIRFFLSLFPPLLCRKLTLPKTPLSGGQKVNCSFFPIPAFLLIKHFFTNQKNSPSVLLTLSLRMPRSLPENTPKSCYPPQKRLSPRCQQTTPLFSTNSYQKIKRFLLATCPLGGPKSGLKKSPKREPK